LWPVAAILGVFLYLILHEFGHCLVVWLKGGKVTEFMIIALSPHMSFEGVLESPLIDVAGAVFPLFFYIIFVLLLKQKIKKALPLYFMIFYCNVYCSSLISWILIPIKYMFGIAPADDDVTKFIRSSNIAPIVVSIVVFVLLAVLSIITVKIIRKYDFNVKTKSIINYIPIVYVIVAVVFLLIPTKEVAYGTFTYPQEGDNLTKLKECYEIHIEKDGKYQVRAKWDIDRDGVIVGIALTETDGSDVYFYSTGAVFADIVSDEIELDSGEYYLLIYSAASSDEWNTLCETFGINLSNFDFEFDSSVEYTATGSYQIIER
ncbi:MAG TPA: hypothetical protein VJY54_09900, partial [Lachnospiraceae bacterium]|nr:hypothetical protein [Lachnospiraceae bacterium]